MKQSVLIKGTKSGIIVHLNEALDHKTLKEEVVKKFEESKDFLGDSKVVLSFEGKKLTQEQEIEFMELIAEHSFLHIVCLVDNDEKKEERFQKVLETKLKEQSLNTGQFYKGNLRSGQVIEFDTSIIVLGDVNPGAQVISSGNVIVLGSLRGTVYAGSKGNQNAFVLALDMRPTQIKIADTIARCSDHPSDHSSTKGQPYIAKCETDGIYMEPLSRDSLRDIRIKDTTNN